MKLYTISISHNLFFSIIEEEINHFAGMYHNNISDFIDIKIDKCSFYMSNLIF